MKPRVHLETTIVSYLTARSSSDVLLAVHQQLTMEWWAQHRSRFEVFASDLVLLEASRGDRAAASKRLAELAEISVLQTNEETRELAREFVNRWLFPKKAVEDAFHVAIATVQGMDFLLSWNCRHIANAEIAEQLRSTCEQLGYKMHKMPILIYAGAIDGILRG